LGGGNLILGLSSPRWATPPDHWVSLKDGAGRIPKYMDEFS
jgi:hypothetical protein